MAYAEVADVQSRITRELSEKELEVCGALLEDAAILIDSYNAAASDEAKKVVSCRAVIRALGNGETSGVPIGASQGSISALGYSQSWTIGNGAAGEIYLSRTEKQMLGEGDTIGMSYSPVQGLIPAEE